MKSIYLIFLCFLLFSAPFPLMAEQVEVTIEGLEGEVLENTKAALTIPSNIIKDNKVDTKWLKYFVDHVDEKVRTALEPFGFYDPDISISQIQTVMGDYHMQVKVDPGKPMRVAEVSIKIKGPGANEVSLKSLVALFPIKQGDILNHIKYENAKGTLKAKALSLGYVDADFSIHKILVSKKDFSSKIVLVLQTGKKYYFGEITIEGTVDYPALFLKRYPAFKAGEVFSYEKLGQTQLNFLNSERFEQVTVTPDRQSVEDQHIPVIIRLKPSSSKRLRFGLGYGTDTGLRFSIKYHDLNSFKSGNEIDSELILSERLQGLNASYILPSRKDLNSFVSFELNLKQENIDTYKTSILSFEAAKTRSIGKGRIFTLFSKLQMEKSDIASKETNSLLIIPGVRFTERRYNDLVKPTKGYKYQVEASGAHKSFGSDISFLQIIVDANTLIPLPYRFSLFTRLKAGFTALDGSIDKLPASLRFFAGGDRSVRGYRYQSLGPKDMEGEVIGGKDLIAGSLEIEYPILQQWGIAAFYDAGNAFNDFSDINIFQGVGLGIRYYTKIGAIRLDVARQIDVDNPGYRIHVNIGFEL